jgi:hypothetical protein
MRSSSQAPAEDKCGDSLLVRDPSMGVVSFDSGEIMAEKSSGGGRYLVKELSRRLTKVYLGLKYVFIVVNVMRQVVG